METRNISTDDGEGHLELHSFRPAERPAPGPGIVVVHGTLVTATLYRPVARKISRLLGRPVHCYNRRGRAGSSPQPPGYSAATEVSDLAAVLRETGSNDVVAHSYGGFVALQAARTVPIRRMVTYDAAVSLSGNLTRRWRPELERSVAAGQLDEAWAHLIQGLETAGPVSKLPLGAQRMLSILSARTSTGAEMRELPPTAVVEMRAVLDADAELADFASVTTPTLMLSGGWSPDYFAETGRQLAAAVPSIESAVLPGQLHESPLRPGIRLPRAAARFLLAGEGTLRPLAGAQAAAQAGPLRGAPLQSVGDPFERTPLAKLYFRYGAMNSGKSTGLLQAAFNYEERGQRVLLAKPDVDTKGDSDVVSRLGMTRSVDFLVPAGASARGLFTAHAHGDDPDALLEHVDTQPVACLLVDEAQFLEPGQVDDLFRIAVLDNVPVLAYGIRTDFRTRAFPGSLRLLEIAHTLEELKTICRCGRKAIFNTRRAGDQVVFDGDQVAIDGQDVWYESLCGSCYLEVSGGRLGN